MKRDESCSSKKGKMSYGIYLSICLAHFISNAKTARCWLFCCGFTTACSSMQLHVASFFPCLVMIMIWDYIWQTFVRIRIFYVESFESSIKKGPEAKYSKFNLLMQIDIKIKIMLHDCTKLGMCFTSIFTLWQISKWLHFSGVKKTHLLWRSCAETWCPLGIHAKICDLSNMSLDNQTASTTSLEVKSQSQLYLDPYKSSWWWCLANGCSFMDIQGPKLSPGL